MRLTKTQDQRNGSKTCLECCRVCAKSNFSVFYLHNNLLIGRKLLGNQCDQLGILFYNLPI